VTIEAKEIGGVIGHVQDMLMNIS